MGTIDGVDFVRKLRDPKESPAPGVPVIFCSRQLDRQLVEDVRDAGINEVIVKPITLGAVKSRIRILFEKPRTLVNLTTYVGPDRRRLHDDNVPRERRAKARGTNSSGTKDEPVDIP
jgi:DNA-binding response OmpR family regulator